MPKWIDNVLSHHSVAGVRQGTRGVERLIDDDGLLALAVCRILAKELGVPLANAVSIANVVVREQRTAHGRFEPARGLTLQFDLGDLEQALQSRLSDAAQSVARIRRGRPPLRPSLE